jgi:hypothetical protein
VRLPRLQVAGCLCLTAYAQRCSIEECLGHHPEFGSDFVGRWAVLLIIREHNISPPKLISGYSAPVAFVEQLLPFQLGVGSSLNEVTRKENGMTGLRLTDFTCYAQVLSDLHTARDISLVTMKDILGVSRGVIGE